MKNHNLLTLKLVQTCMSFFLEDIFLEYEDILKTVCNQAVDSSHSLP